MCIIIAKPEGNTVPWEHVKNASEFNTHGYGVSIREKYGIKIRKFLDWKQFETFTKPLCESGKDEIVVHLRYATHGSRTLSNVHPFRTSQGYALHHNGIFNIKSINDKTDSELFKEAYFDNKDPDEYSEKSLKSLLGGSKLALHTPKGITIYNKDLGVELNGVWYSNDGFKSYDMGWDTPVSPMWGELDSEELYEYLMEIIPDTDPLKKKRLINELIQYVVECEDCTQYSRLKI